MQNSWLWQISKHLLMKRKSISRKSKNITFNINICSSKSKSFRMPTKPLMRKNKNWKRIKKRQMSKMKIWANDWLKSRKLIRRDWLLNYTETKTHQLESLSKKKNNKVTKTKNSTTNSERKETNLILYLMKSHIWMNRLGWPKKNGI